MDRNVVTLIALCNMGAAACAAELPADPSRADSWGAKVDGEERYASLGGEERPLFDILADYVQAACAHVATREEATRLVDECIVSGTSAESCFAERGFQCSNGMLRLAEMAPDMNPQDVIDDDRSYLLRSAEARDDAFGLVAPGSSPILTVSYPGAHAFYLDGDGTTCAAGEAAQPFQCVEVARVDPESGVFLDAAYKTAEVLTPYVAAGCARNVSFWESSSLSPDQVAEVLGCLLEDPVDSTICDDDSYLCSDEMLQLASMVRSARMVSRYDTATFIAEEEGSHTLGGSGARAEKVVALPGLQARFVTRESAKAYYLCEGSTECSGDGCVCIR